MALTVNFWTTSKKENSTAIPSGNPTRSFACELKSDSGIMSPVLEIGLPMSENPAAWNYAQIPEYYRYYRVTDWQWSGGLWLCSLEVDPLASWRSHIGHSTHYVLRSSYAHNLNALDDFYPALCWRPNYYTDSVSFGFTQNMGSSTDGIYILGVAAQGTGAGPVTYYALTISEISDLVDYMLRSPIQSAQSWTTPISGLTDLLYRSIYQPFDYIKSCKWFPVGSFSSQYNSILKFGNYEAVDDQGTPEAVGVHLGRNAANWPSFTRTLDLPTGWLSLEAKYRTPPYANLYIVFNPFGVIELNPLDFTDSDTIELELLPDYVSGDALLKIYKVVGSSRYFITEKTTKIAIDINLSASNMDASGLVGNLTGAAGSLIRAAAAPNKAEAAIAMVGAAGGIASAGAAAVPTMSNSVGSSFGGPRSMEGTATLIYTSTYFASEDNNDFGRPLLDSRQLDTIPGYIKCADGHIEIPGYAEEIQRINEYLTGGFFYE